MIMKGMSSFVLFLLACQSPVVLTADETYDRADAVFLDVLDEYTLEEDGAVKHRHMHKVRLLTGYAIHRLLGETFIVYNPRYQELKINKAVTVMADGKQVPCTPNAFNEVLPGFCRNAAPYMHLREMVITHLGLEKGAVIELDYEIRSKPGYYPFLMGEQLFSSTHPIENKTVMVTVPQGVELNARFLHIEEGEWGGGEMIEGGVTRHIWGLQNIPMAPPEGMAKAPADYAPLLVFSTCPSWTDAAGRMDQRMSSAAWLDDKIESKVRKMVSESTGKMDLLLAINRFVAEEVADAAVDPRYLGYEMVQAKETFHDNVGCSLDKAMLLTSMLRTAGFLAEPVLISRHWAVAMDVPTWDQFSESRVLVRLAGRMEKPLYLSPSRLIAGPFEDGLAGRTVFRPLLKNVENILLEIPPAREKDNRVRADLHLALDDAGHLKGEIILELEGSLNPYLTLVDDGPGWAAGRMKRLLPGASFGEVKPLLLSENKSVFKGNTKDPAQLEEEHGLLHFRVPSCPDGVSSMHIPSAPRSRTTPLRLPRPMTEDVRVTIKLPETAEVLSKPDSVELSNDAGMILSGAWVEEGKLHVNRVLILRQSVPAEKYADLRALLREWEADDARGVILKIN